MKRLIALLLLLVPSVAMAQIKGPETVKPGELVHLTISAPAGSDVLFELVDPLDLDFLEFKSDGEAHFVCPAGCVARKMRVLAMSINFDSKTIKRERHTVTVEGDVPVPPNPQPPGPGPQPTPGKRQVTIIHETGEAGPEFARLKVELRKPQFSEELKSKGHSLAILDKDNDAARTLLGKINPPPKLPCLVVTDGSGAVVASSELPGTVAGVSDFIKKAGG